VNHGEAYLVVYNNTDKALSLPGGKLKVTVKPIISLPICRNASPEFQELKRQSWKEKEENEWQVEKSAQEGKPEDRDEKGPMPRSRIVWASEGMSDRIKSGDLNRLYRFIRDFKPDMLGFLDIKWEREGEDHTRVKKGTEGETHFKWLQESVGKDYNLYLNLSEKKYGDSSSW
jgi:hypothetical protein